MGTVIKFPRVRRRRKTPDRAASADIIILPVVRIERMSEAPSGIRVTAARSAARPFTKSAVKPASGRRRRKPVALPLPSPACGRG